MEEGRGFRGSIMMLFLLALFISGSSENDTYFKMCGTWRHGNKPLSLAYDLKVGCQNIVISASETSLSLGGHITARCQSSSVLPLATTTTTESSFCVYWEPLLDHLWVEVNGQNHTLCSPSGLQEFCCTDLSQGVNHAKGTYGIADANVRDDVITSETRTAYSFEGDKINCKKEFCDEASQGSNQINRIEETVMRSQVLGSVELPCAQSSVVEMKEDFQGQNITLLGAPGVDPETTPKVHIHLPSCLKPLGKKKAKVVCTYFKNSTLFQGHSKADQNDIRILDDVVGITVENEVISNLPEPIRIGFHHALVPPNHSRKCVSWDSKKDPGKLNWKEDGCVTVLKGAEETECQCNHLTYFAILVQLEPRPVHHLLALSIVTSLGCATSMLSCVILIVFLNKQRRMKEQSTPVHRGLAVALFLLNLFFFLTGTLANVFGEEACMLVGAALHYALLSSFSWMAIEVFHTFWLVYVVFSPSPKPYVWYLVGFGASAVPVGVLLAIGNIYGVREVVPADDVNNPYLMCWMKSSDEALLAHYFTNLTFLAVLVLSGLVMLFLVLGKIQNRDEWRRNRVAFLSIWGLSCLFGTTWGLGFLDFGPLSEVVLFLFCILNSFQGFFLMLRFYVLDRMRKQSDSSLGGSSTGSTRQHMLQQQEKS